MAAWLRALQFKKWYHCRKSICKRKILRAGSSEASPGCKIRLRRTWRHPSTPSARLFMSPVCTQLSGAMAHFWWPIKHFHWKVNRMLSGCFFFVWNCFSHSNMNVVVVSQFHNKVFTTGLHNIYNIQERWVTGSDLVSCSSILPETLKQFMFPTNVKFLKHLMCSHSLAYKDQFNTRRLLFHL